MLGSLWFSSFNSGGGAASDYELISTAFGTGASGTITFGSLPATYKHFQIRLVAQSTSGAPTDLYMRFNGDSTSGNYKDHRVYGYTGSVYSGTIGTNAIYAGTIGGVGEGDLVAPVIMDILDPLSTTKNKTARYLSGKPSGNIVMLGSGAWFSTSAVTSIALYINSGSLTSISRFSLYGLKG